MMVLKMINRGDEANPDWITAKFFRAPKRMDLYLTKVGQEELVKQKAIQEEGVNVAVRRMMPHLPGHMQTPETGAKIMKMVLDITAPLLADGGLVGE